MKIEIRQAQEKDINDITNIYNDAILNTTATFDTTPKTKKEQLDWYNEHDDSFLILVAHINDKLVGWASINRWSNRCAYSNT